VEKTQKNYVITVCVKSLWKIPNRITPKKIEEILNVRLETNELERRHKTVGLSLGRRRK
jgi:hypothetical protein